MEGGRGGRGRGKVLLVSLESLQTEEEGEVCVCGGEQE